MGNLCSGGGDDNDAKVDVSILSAAPNQPCQGPFGPRQGSRGKYSACLDN